MDSWHRAASSAAISRSARSLRPRARSRARQPHPDRAKGDDVPRGGRSRESPSRTEGRTQRGRAHRDRVLSGDLPRSRLGPRRRVARAAPSPDAERLRQQQGGWSLCLVQAYALKGDAASMRSHAEEARKAFEDQLRAAPEDAQLHALLGLALAYLGKKDEAVREGERAVALLPVTKDAYLGPYLQHQLARIYILVGEPEKALDHLEPLLKIPYLLSPGWLRIDPNFEPLRKNPRFEKLAAPI